ncbi:hypothetical protein MCOR02_003515 [Pyricularia oryzae]|uniref:Uncharacterized protein n=1 Tax=Pyricularia oryzae TaxID=318829 RepID=A0A4P7N9M4_PYROR|nr:hypothetical protein MCOR02_003515 [Pyricularia oryzae]KAI6477974.1 hypothetical protein MCOR17_000280 [Pyricularia oryzae]KAI6562871.1 hypothetical protein MCOR04_009266 [Pyricularia oryzae]KAI6623206.1 hypothetical protein MCOR14_009608 [Pyricularia oryzae]QBZ57716.1 hypothetical protein PoMZ_02651 [Pyricularia oryzae]
MTATGSTGARMLGEIEETTLEEILNSLRVSIAALDAETQPVTGPNPPSTSIITTPDSKRRGPPQPKTFPIAPLNDLAARHGRATGSALVSISGRHLALLHLLIATLIAPPHSKAVVVVDLDGRFDPVRVLQCTPWSSSSDDNGNSITRPTPADLDHVHVHRPARTSGPQSAVIRAAVATAEQHLVYGRHGSVAREWWGTVVVGGAVGAAAAAAGDGEDGVASAAVDVVAGPRGWLRVERHEVPGFGLGMSVEEALVERERRRRAVEEAGWKAGSVWGGFGFGEA